MALYMTQFAYTPEVWATLAKNPQDRREGVSAACSKVGGRLVSLYYCFGEYDGVVIFEAPDDVAAAAIPVSAAAAGLLKMMKTTRLLTVEETMDAMRRAGSIEFQGLRKS